MKRKQPTKKAAGGDVPLGVLTLKGIASMHPDDRARVAAWLRAKALHVESAAADEYAPLFTARYFRNGRNA